MDSQTEVIRQQMDETRTALSEKLGLLEEQVTEKVQQATSSVTQTVETVSETVEGAVESVKHTFDLNWHAQNHPWMLMGGAVLVGFLGARLLLPPSRPPRRERREPRGRYQPPSPPPPPPPRPEPPKAPESSESGGFFGALHEVGGHLKKLGIGMAMGVAREVVTRSLPTQIGPPLSDAINGLTRKLGGEPMGVSEQDHPSTKDPASQEEQPGTCGSGI